MAEKNVTAIIVIRPLDLVMTDPLVPDPEVNAFLMSFIDTVPHLEALLLFWNSRPRPWSVDQMAKSLYIDASRAKIVLEDLHRYGLIGGAGQSDFLYDSTPEKDRVVGLIDERYRRDLIGISTMIHAKPPAAIREFAKAFRFKKERE
jgi:hypothetical protein